MKIGTRFVAILLVALLSLGAAAGAQEKKATKKAAPKAEAKEKATPKKAATEDQEVKITKKDVPAEVIAAFEKAYPKATVKGYSKEVEKGQTLYEVESLEGKTTRDILYSADGKTMETEEGVEVKDLPAAVTQALEKKYPGAKIRKAEKLTKVDWSGFEIAVTTKDNKKAEFVSDAKGKEAKQ